MSATEGVSSRVIGRYAILEEIAAGGMATVHLGRLVGTGGFSRNVAIKRLHAHLARDPEFVKMFLDEARIAARIQHPNVVPVLDVVNAEGEIFLVMEYVAGESLAALARVASERGAGMPVSVAAAIVVGVLRGLHAAHEATDEHGQPLCIVHRDVSPQNILVGRDGVAHLLDFGVAKAAGQLQSSRNGHIKGKVSYMPPEQARGAEVTRAVDVYAVGVVLWELLAGARLFSGDNEANVLERVLFAEVTAPSRQDGSSELDETVMRAISRDPAARFATARDMARAIEAAVSIASTSEVAEWIESLGSARPLDSEVALVAGSPDAPGDPKTSGVRLSALRGAEPRVDPVKPHRVSRLAGGLILLALGAAGAFAVARWERHAVPAPVVISPAPAALPPAPIMPVATSTESVAGPSEPVTAKTAHPAPGSPGTRPVARPPAAAAPRAPRDACNPPYTVDADGVKQYKVQCL